MQDVLEAWEKNGRDAIEKVVNDDPAAFLKVVASLIPKEIAGENGQPIKIIMLPGDENL